MAFAVRDPNDPNKVLVTEGRIDLRVKQLHQPGVNHSTTIVNTDGEIVLGDDERETDVLDNGDARTALDRAVANGTVDSVHQAVYYRRTRPFPARSGSPSRAFQLTTRSPSEMPSVGTSYSSLPPVS